MSGSEIMTCIAVKNYEHKIELCCDSQSTSGNEKIGNHIKIYTINPTLIISYAGDVKAGSILIHWAKFNLPERNDVQCITDWLLKFSLYYKDKFNEQFKNNHLIIFEETIYQNIDFWVTEITDYTAIGSGYVEARTALHLGKTAFESVEIACSCNVWCCLPVQSLEITKL